MTADARVVLLLSVAVYAAASVARRYASTAQRHPHRPVTGALTAAAGQWP